ncbi:MAG: Lrp/AsnC family transcriptional regulator [Candidatus Thorarchaeota archaeon]|nr:Lrp/AsnC family transcriptional regulator [Candidatus Thorarchaeota archaeon]
MPKLDHIDRKILGILATDCRAPYREIAKSLGMSVTAIKSRVDDMVAGGAIIDFTVELSPAMIGSELISIWLKTGTINDTEQFISDIAANRSILQITPIYGGDYLVFAEYTSSLELAALTEAFSSNPHIASTEVHTILTQRGKKASLTNLQLRILKALLKDARMLISDIASETGLTVRLVRRTLRELKQSEAIRFSLRCRFNVGDRLTFLLKLEWDPKQVSREKITDLLLTKYQDIFWDLFISASEPILMGAAIVDNLNQVDTLTTELKFYPGIIYSEAFVYRPAYRYKGIKRLLLEETVQAAGV